MLMHKTFPVLGRTVNGAETSSGLGTSVQDFHAWLNIGDIGVLLVRGGSDTRIQCPALVHSMHFLLEEHPAMESHDVV
jgi:hypothetical protein